MLYTGEKRKDEARASETKGFESTVPLTTEKVEGQTFHALKCSLMLPNSIDLVLLYKLPQKFKVSTIPPP